MKHDNVKLGRVSNVAQHSHAYDCMCVAGAEGYVWRSSMTSQEVGAGDISREVSTDDAMVDVCLISNNDVLEYECDCSIAVKYDVLELEYEYDRSMVVKYDDTKRYIGRNKECGVDSACNAKTKQVKTDVTTSRQN